MKYKSAVGHPSLAVACANMDEQHRTAKIVLDTVCTKIANLGSKESKQYTFCAGGDNALESTLCRRVEPPLREVILLTHLAWKAYYINLALTPTGSQ